MKQGYGYSQGLGVDRNRFKTLSTGTWVMGKLTCTTCLVWVQDCRTHIITARSLGTCIHIHKFSGNQGVSLLKQQYCDMNYHSKLGDNTKFIISSSIINSGKIGS